MELIYSLIIIIICGCIAQILIDRNEIRRAKNELPKLHISSQHRNRTHTNLQLLPQGKSHRVSEVGDLPVIQPEILPLLRKRNA
jgi:hypothetical protein